MKKIKLYGEWGKRFGREFELDVKTPAEAFKALCVQVKGFREFLHSHAGDKVSIFVGRENISERGLSIQTGSDVIRIVPVIEGSGGGKGTNWALVIVGIIIMVVGAMYDWSGTSSGAGYQMMVMGLGMSLFTTGVSGLLAKKPPSMRAAEAAEARDSFSFGGPVNTAAQGNPVPVCYGKMVVGSQVISLGLITN